KSGPYGKRITGELWAAERSDDLDRRLPSHPGTGATGRAAFDAAPADEVRLVVHTQPSLVTGVPSKNPEVFEIRVSGEKVDERRAYGVKVLGSELGIAQVAKEGEFVDVLGVTKGKGFQGHTKRWGVKLQPRKNSKHRRMIGTLGPHNPSFVTYRIPQAGQMGFHRRTQFNMRVLKIVRDPPMEPSTPAGGLPPPWRIPHPRGAPRPAPPPGATRPPPAR